jgi:kynurenine formamidase
MEKEGPHWPGASTCDAVPQNRISEGSAYNTFEITLMNHYGTHIDAPRHYSETLPKITELPFETFISERPLMVEIPKTFNEVIRREELEPYAAQLRDADSLLVRTGFCKHRNSEPERFAVENPTLDSEACKYLMDSFRLKSLAMDWISLTNPSRMEDGNQSHRYLLGHYHDHFTCIVEDACFDGIAGKKIKRVYTIPLLVGMGVDSGPVTMFAEI